MAAADDEAPALLDQQTGPTPLTLRQLALHVALFVAACATTTWAGGVIFAATLMGILLCHEMGHYVAARRYHLDVSPPYFIPLPPQISLGTLGAIIRMRQPIRDRDQLLVVGAAGPLAGLVVAIPCLIVGLSLSEVGTIAPGSVLEGTSALYGAFKLTIFGRWLPHGTEDVQLHPMAFAAWYGLLVTMINLVPIGQLDGGHVMRAWLGERHERLSGLFHWALLGVGAIAGTVLFIQARAADAGALDAAQYALVGVLPWLVWAIALLVMRRMAGGEYHPEVFGPPLSPRRRWLAMAMVALFLLLFVPVPLRPAL
ncbi:MAG: site-2 protease family protein [Myxococcales bacterium]|nr:site-2 protease family protein [Myxococcales bacterium]